MKKLFSTGFLTLLMLAGTALAHGDDTAPVWTYWVEIAEHTAIIIVAIAGIAHIIPLRKKMSANMKSKLNTMLFGLVLLVISQILTDMQHFLIYPFGVLSAIVDHGFLVAAIIVIVYAYVELVKSGKLKP